ncbi:multidrug ABC transporter ATP-binding protein [Lachnospiraceae bacterium]|uniref:ABC transporter ATP-binding protein n=1 Tax=Extibacter sp. GGCC_0201 TaxID=2731209 RepID=UPI001AA1C873|nr:ABC transporter ATP-binding protein [Extibacter sp. GGCC_0201]MBO1719376.1 ABC transporter ATP-binding protein [Extibacter sp. GGCC_0201]BDF32538.1 multidrug ABC transporter ATP-binding protein [Lachnospiraceae bacterium]BDF36548.1 multidrug ABC transporter ATP-binding protein [Lachnospiraceae bacterium]
MRRLLKYLKKHPVVTVLAPLFKMLEASFELFVPLVVARMIDVGIGRQRSAYLWQMGGILILLGIVGFGFSVTAQYFAAKSAVSAGMAMRNDLFAHINTLSYKEIDTVGTSTLINRMTNDINQVQNGINMFLRLFLRSPFVVFGAMIMAFTVEVKAALPFAAAIPLLLVVVFAILLVSMPLYRKVQKQVDKVLLSTRENLLGIRVVRAFNHQDSEMEHFRQESGSLFQKQIHVGKISALLNPLTYVIINLGIIAILWSGGRQVNIGSLTQGQVIALINYMSQILAELIKLANLIILLSKSMASLNRVNQIFDMHPSIDGAGLPLPAVIESVPAVRFKDVSFRYADAGKETLSGLNFTAMPGQTIGIIGGTGSGKTSLVNLIPRFYDVSEGKVLLNGQDVKASAPASIRSHIGLVPQKAQLFKGTLRENMQWGEPDASEEDIYHALDTAQAREFVDSRQKGLELMIEQDGGNLSGGQKQRLTIARALVRRPGILILDDSASALDFATDAKLRSAIRQDTRQMTVFLVSQRVSAIKNADQIIVLDDGHIAGTGTHDVLLDTCAVYKEIYESQISGQEVAHHADA